MTIVDDIINEFNEYTTIENAIKLISRDGLTSRDKSILVTAALERMPANRITVDGVGKLLGINGLDSNDKAIIAEAALNHMPPDHITAGCVDDFLNIEGLSSWYKADIAEAALNHMPVNLITEQWVDKLLTTARLDYFDKAQIATAALNRMPPNHIAVGWVESLLRMDGLDSSMKFDIAEAALNHMPSNLITVKWLGELLATEGLSSWNKADIAKAALNHMPPDSIKVEWVDSLLKIDGLDLADKVQIATAALKHMPPDSIKVEWVDSLLKIEGLDSDDKADIAITVSGKLLQQNMRNEGLFEYVRKQIPEDVIYDYAKLGNLIFKLVDTEHYVGCVQYLLPNSPFMRAMVYSSLIERTNHTDLTFQTLAAMINDVDAEDITIILKEVKDNTLVIQALEESTLHTSYDSVKQALGEHTLDAIITPNELQSFKDDMGLDSIALKDLKGMKARTIYMLADIKGLGDKFFPKIKKDVLTAIQKHFVLTKENAHVTEQENYFIKALMPEDSPYSAIPTLTSLCAAVKAESDKNRNSASYLDANNNRDAYQLALPEDTAPDKVEAANATFKAIFEASADEGHEKVRDFISAVAKVYEITDLYYTPSVIYNIKDENLQKVYKVFADKEKDIRFAFQDTDALRSIVIGSSTTSAHGCVANYGTTVDMAIQELLMTSYSEQKLYNVLHLTFNKLNSQIGGDILGGTSKCDFLTIEALTTATINPIGLIKELARQITAKDFTKDGIRREFPEFFQAYDYTTIYALGEMLKPPYDHEMLALEILRKILPPDEYVVIQDVYFLEIAKTQEVKDVQELRNFVKENSMLAACAVFKNCLSELNLTINNLNMGTITAERKTEIEQVDEDEDKELAYIKELISPHILKFTPEQHAASKKEYAVEFIKDILKGIVTGEDSGKVDEVVGNVDCTTNVKAFATAAKHANSAQQR